MMITGVHSVLKSNLKHLYDMNIPKYNFSDVTTGAENVFNVHVRCRSREEDECHCWQTGNWDTDLCDSANRSCHKDQYPSYKFTSIGTRPRHGCTCDRRSMADMTDIPQATDNWVETWEQGTADRRLATCLRASMAWYSGGASSAIQQ